MSWEQRSKKIITKKGYNRYRTIIDKENVSKLLRKEYSITGELHEKILIVDRIKILNKHITETYKEGRSKRINHIAQEIRDTNG